MLDQIRKRVSQEILSSHNQVILGVYKGLVKSHNDFCGCEYCQLLNEYIRLKKFYTLKKRMFDNEDYCLDYRAGEYEGERMRQDANYLTELQDKIQELKIKKDQLKL